MNSGTQQKALVDLLLTNVSNGYFPKEFICEKILPEIQHKNDTGKLGKYGSSHLRIVNTITGGKGKYRQVDGVAYDSTGFSIESHGLSDLVTKKDYRNVTDPFKVEQDKILALATILWLEKEKGLADVLGNTAVLTQNTTLVGSQQYNDKLNSDPVSDFENAQAAVVAGCGEKANTGIMSWEVFNKLKSHPQILDFLGYKFNRPGGLTEQELCEAMGVEKLLIGMARYNSAAEGQAAVLSPVWGKNVIFAVCPDKAGLQQQSLGYTVRLEGEAARKAYKTPVSNPPGSNELICEDEYDQLISNASAAYLIKNAIA